MKTGFSKICITPPYGSPMFGYYEDRRVKGVLDDLFVRAVAFDDGEKKAVVIAIDICTMAQCYYHAMKKAICEALPIDHDAVFINLSHTHTGPTVGKDFASDLCSTKAYDDFLIKSVRDSAIYAFSDLADSTLSTASAEAKNISFIRRYRMQDGSVLTNPGINNPDIDRALGTPDESVRLVKIERKNSDDIYIVNFGTHTDCVGGSYISADYVGFVCSILEKAIPNSKCIFLQGFQGDVNHVNINPSKGESSLFDNPNDFVPQSHAHAEHMARVIVGAVLSVCSITEPSKADNISFASSHVFLPSHKENHRLEEAKRIWELHEAGCDAEIPHEGMELVTVVAEAKRILNLENGPKSFPFFLSALKIGELVFAGIGGEPFTEIGNRIYKNSPFENIILCCLTNSEGGYIPTTQAYEEGGYEARTSRLAPGGDDIIVDGMTALLNSL